ncbi:MAG: ABC transporter ATP-binding protein [Candidatus Nanoarchaeia archaeon]
MKSIIATKNLKKIYSMGLVEVNAVNGISVNIEKGDFVMIAGPSGSGKSTLLHLLGLLDDPSAGSITIDGEEVADLDEKRKSEFRLTKLGYVFQEFALLAELTALENVTLTLMQRGLSKKKCEKTGMDILNKVGLSDRAKHYPSELSGGQMQRVSIARALVNEPKILFADEPTANLDSKTGNDILKLFSRLNKELNQTICLVSHEPEHKKFVKRLIELKDGVIVKDVRKGR